MIANILSLLRKGFNNLGTKIFCGYQIQKRRLKQKYYLTTEQAYEWRKIHLEILGNLQTKCTNPVSF